MPSLDVHSSHMEMAVQGRRVTAHEVVHRHVGVTKLLYPVDDGLIDIHRSPLVYQSQVKERDQICNHERCDSESLEGSFEWDGQPDDIASARVVPEIMQRSGRIGKRNRNSLCDDIECKRIYGRITIHKKLCFERGAPMIRTGSIRPVIAGRPAVAYQ